MMDELDEYEAERVRDERFYFRLVVFACVMGVLWGTVKVVAVIMKHSPELWPFV